MSARWVQKWDGGGGGGWEGEGGSWAGGLPLATANPNVLTLELLRDHGQVFSDSQQPVGIRC